MADDPRWLRARHGHPALTGALDDPHGASRRALGEPGRTQTLGEPSRAVPCRAEPSRAEPSRAEPCRAEPSRAMPCHAEPYRAMTCYAVHNVESTASATAHPHISTVGVLMCSRAARAADFSTLSTADTHRRVRDGPDGTMRRQPSRPSLPSQEAPTANASGTPAVRRLIDNFSRQFANACPMRPVRWRGGRIRSLHTERMSSPRIRQTR